MGFEPRMVRVTTAQLLLEQAIALEDFKRTVDAFVSGYVGKHRRNA